MKTRNDKGWTCWLEREIDRRTFLQATASLAAAASGSALFGRVPSALAQAFSGAPADLGDTSSAVAFVYSSCQNCHSRCGLRAKVANGVLLKIDGNPYHPNNKDPDEMLPFGTPTEEARKVRGRMCAKGQAGIQVVYDPMRLTTPLKRVGPRGSGQWTAISWDQALTEIASKLKPLMDTDTLIDPSAPELGPIANQVAFSPGRIVHGDKEFTDRIWKDGFGTVNYRHDHTSICEVSHHVGNELITWDRKAKKGRKEHFKPDILDCEYIIFFGANPLEANFPMVALGRKLMEMKARGGRYVVVDPRFSNSAAQASQWVPIKPGTDAALALGMARWIIDNDRYDARYLENTTKAAAEADGETTWTDSSYLVRLDTKAFLRASDAGLGGTEEQYVVWKSGAPAIHDATDSGELLPGQVSVNGIPCMTAFELFVNRVREKTIAEYSAICGIDQATIEGLADEFTSHGKKAVANTYRGAVQHTNGVYNQLAIMALNTLIGNYDWKGGNTAGGGGWDEIGTKGAPGQVDVTKVPGGVSAKGIPINRAKKNYEKDAPNIFARDGGYPAKRPWFPYALHGNYQEVIPSAADGYPYPLKALITYWNAWPYSTPALRYVFEDYVRDESRLELFVAISVNIGEVAAFADYILPDTTYLEKWATPHGTPTILTKFRAIRQPVVGYLDGKPIGSAPFDPDAPNVFTSFLSKGNVAVDPRTAEGPMMLEDIMIALGKKLGIPGVGANAFADGGSLDTAWDFKKRLFQNIAADHGATSIQEIVAKGGAFEDPGNEHDGEHVKHKYANEIHLYIEELAITKDSMTGEFFDGLPKYDPIRNADGTLVEDTEFPLHLVTFKTAIHAQARTANLPWLMLLEPENFVLINPADAAPLGIETGTRVRLTSHSDRRGVIGRAQVTERVRPGVVAVSHHYGHWELHSRPHQIDGVTQPYDASRGAGIQVNPIMRLDSFLRNVTLQDKIGCSASFYDTRVRVERV